MGEFFGFRIKLLRRPWVILLRGMVLLRWFLYQNFGDFCKGGLRFRTALVDSRVCKICQPQNERRCVLNQGVYVFFQ